MNMAYQDRWGVTDIRDGVYGNLQLCWDVTNSTGTEILAVIRFTPDMTNTDRHYHISLDLSQCKTLKEWLDQHIKRLENDNGNPSRTLE
jgi:hypothetical protein